jgi:glycosyltransferase involved in cell wall biosynthesis
MQRRCANLSDIWIVNLTGSVAKLLASILHPKDRLKRKAARHRLITNWETRGFRSFRLENSLSTGLRQTCAFSPNGSVTAIIPNYNHAHFLQDRINSILKQTFAVTEIIILDDASTDHSRDVIAEAIKTSPVPIKTCFNPVNSRNIFTQWEKGLELASGDLIWICESDDTCDPEFLSFLLPHFADTGTMLAFGRIEFIDETGTLRHDVNDHVGLDRFSDSGEARLASASSWFNGPFGLSCIIRNVGGCVFRRQTISESLLAELKAYKTCGDWLLYSRLARGGQIVYDPRALSYFRLHGANSSVRGFETIGFYDEHVRIAYALRRHYGVNIRTLRTMLRKVWHQCKSRLGKTQAIEFANRISLKAIAAQPRAVQHILIGIDQDNRNGGEAFPLLFIDDLLRQGHDVSLLIIGAKAPDREVQSLLNKGIPIFTPAHVDRTGLESFIRDFGVTLINTRHVRVDDYFYQLSPRIGVPYIVTDHPSYQKWSIDEKFARWLCCNVDAWTSAAGDIGIPKAIACKTATGNRRFITQRLRRSKSSDKKNTDLVKAYVAEQSTFFSSD